MLQVELELRAVVVKTMDNIQYAYYTIHVKMDTSNNQLVEIFWLSN